MKLLTKLFPQNHRLLFPDFKQLLIHPIVLNISSFQRERKILPAKLAVIIHRTLLHHRVFPADNMEQKDEAQLCALLQIRNDAYEEAVYFGAPSYMDVEEIILLYSPAHKEELETKMQQHIERQITAFKGYGEQQTRMLEDAQVSVIGDYAVCVVSGSSATMQAVKDALR